MPNQTKLPAILEHACDMTQKQILALDTLFFLPKNQSERLIKAYRLRAEHARKLASFFLKRGSK